MNHPALKNYVQAVIERSILDWLNPVVDRSVKVAATTTENIVKKVCFFINVIIKTTYFKINF